MLLSSELRWPSVPSTSPNATGGHVNRTPCRGQNRSSKMDKKRTETGLHSVAEEVSEIAAIAGIRLMIGGKGIKLLREINSDFNNAGGSL